MEHEWKYLNFVTQFCEWLTICMQILPSIVDPPSMLIAYELEIKYVCMKLEYKGHIA